MAEYSKSDANYRMKLEMRSVITPSLVKQTRTLRGRSVRRSRPGSFPDQCKVSNSSRLGTVPGRSRLEKIGPWVFPVARKSKKFKAYAHRTINNLEQTPESQPDEVKSKAKNKEAWRPRWKENMASTTILFHMRRKRRAHFERIQILKKWPWNWRQKKHQDQIQRIISITWLLGRKIPASHTQSSSLLGQPPW